MTPEEVVWFINHKYGEQAYLVETDEQILIFSRVSKWVIFKKDFTKFHIYTLFILMIQSANIIMFKTVVLILII
jgi:hypothetical protein